MADKKETPEERARRLQELIDAPKLPKPTSPHAFVQEQMRKMEQARKAGKPTAPEPEKPEPEKKD